MSTAPVGYAEDEIDTAAPTRSARLKWVVVVDETLPSARAGNPAVCGAAATGAQVAGLLGPAAQDSSGSEHPGLPWAGCTVLAADAATLRMIRAKAEAHEGTFVADMPAAAQDTRVYDEYREVLGATAPELVEYLAVGLIGPRNRIDKIVGRLRLL